MINTALLPRDLHDPVSYCLYKANQCAKTEHWKNSHINIIAARVFAAMVPVAAAAYSIDRLCRGSYHVIAYQINPALVNPHINGAEEIREGLKCMIFAAISVAYAALSILFGKIVIQTMCPSTEFRDLYKRNLEVCQAIANGNSMHHLDHHNGVLLSKPPKLIHKSEMDAETMQILQETYNLAKINSDQAVVEKAFKKIISTADPLYGWTPKVGFDNQFKDIYSDDDALSQEFDRLISTEDPGLQRVYHREDVITFLSTKYNKSTVKEVVSFYSKEPLAKLVDDGFSKILEPSSERSSTPTMPSSREQAQGEGQKARKNSSNNFASGSKEDFITSRQFHAILIGIQANLSLEDISGQESDSTEELIKKLNEQRTIKQYPSVYYADKYYIQYDRDRRFLAQLSNYIPPDPNDKENNAVKYGFSEYLSRTIIYNLFRDQQVKAVLDPIDERKPRIKEGLLFQCHYLGSETLFKIKRVYCKNGIAYAHVASVGSDRPKIGATVFRGVHDWEAVKRVFEYWWIPEGGIGKLSFNRKSKSIIDDFYKQYENQDTYYVVGHSLGAIDSQRFVHALVRSDKKLPKQLFLETYNSPGVERTLEEKFLDSTSKMENCQLSITHTRVIGDIIQIPGKVLLGHTSTNTKNVTYTFRQESLKHCLTQHERHILPVYLQLPPSSTC